MARSMASVVFAEPPTGLAAPQVEQRHAQHRVSEVPHPLRWECKDPKGLAVTVGLSEGSRVALPPATLRLRQELRT